MKRGILIGIALCLLMGAAASRAPKHWQDLLLRLDQPWINAYGYDPESVLAFNVRKNNLSIGLVSKQTNDHEKRIAVLEALVNVDDPNEPK